MARVSDRRYSSGGEIYHSPLTTHHYFVVGLSAVVPCVILLWIGFKVYAILAGSSQDRATLPSLAPAGGGSKLIAEEDKGPEGEPTPKP